MKKIVVLLATLAVLNLASSGPQATRTAANASPAAILTKANTHIKVSAHSAVYDQLNLSQAGLRKDVFEYALRGWQHMTNARPIVSIVDLSQPSTKKRLYVIDLLKGKLLFNTYVSHGRNSGDLMAQRFSNANSSFQSSLGFYQTMGTYMGKHGLSLQLKGLEKGFNDQVQNRNIVMHGADYVCEEFIRKTGRLGRSQGCPAVPYALSKDIIEAVKGGSCLFVYSPNADYMKKSSFLASALASL